MDPPGINTISAGISAQFNDCFAEKMGFLIKKESVRDKIKKNWLLVDFEVVNIIYVNKKVFEEVLGVDFILEVLTSLL